MKIYTSFLDSELKEILESSPTKAVQLLKQKLLKKLKHKGSLVTRQVKFLNQYVK